MPDITMCKGEGCKKKKKCYRYTAEPTKYWKSYFVKSPVDDTGNCPDFWPVKSKKG